MAGPFPRTWGDDLDRAVDRVADRIVAIRRHLHAHPEPSGHEFATTRYLADALAIDGLSVRLAPSGRGLLVDGPTSGPRIAIRADIDALRIQDAKPVPYCSQVPGVMHACGHDSHAAMVAGAAMALAAASAGRVLPWPVAWRAILQPAEETSEGALEMMAAGALDDVAAILGLHVDPSRQTGRIGVRSGALTAACDELEVRIDGRGGHSARPHEAVDPIVAAVDLVQALYLFVPRAADAQDPVVLTIAQIAGGDSANVIPDRVVLRGTLRTLGEARRRQTQDHIRRIARGVAEVSGAGIDVAFLAGTPAVVNDDALTAVLRQAAAAVVGAEGIDDIARPSMGGEDFACYLERVRGAMFRLGCGGAPSSPVLHSPLFDLDERALAVGAKTLARAVVLAAEPGRAWRAPS